MELTGEYWIEVHREVAWRLLLDPDVLARCVDGCQSFEARRGGRYEAMIKVKVGPVHGDFEADLEILNPIPPRACSIAAQIKGGMAGFARGTAHISLAEEGERTSLLYKIEGEVGGKLEQLSEEEIAEAARKTADDFFTALNIIAAPRPGRTPPPAPHRSPSQWLNWAVIGAAVLTLAAILGVWLLRR
jgi:carbon monoxide dehydrogenase subunit G